MVARHHDHADAGLPAIGDRLFHLRPAEGRESRPSRGSSDPIVRARLQRDRLLGEGEDAQTILSQRRGTPQPLLPLLFAKRYSCLSADRVAAASTASGAPFTATNRRPSRLCAVAIILVSVSKAISCSSGQAMSRSRGRCQRAAKPQQRKLHRVAGAALVVWS